MPAFFKPHANTVFRVLLVSGFAAPFVLVGGLLLLARSPVVTQVDMPDNQPIEFDHRHHVGDEGIDCRYCHTSVEVSSTAGYPPLETCMGCHNQIWNKAALLAPVRDAYFEGRAIPWQKIYRVPDYVFFNHAIHVNKGVGCESCHGRVDRQAAITRAATLSMQWCLECHRNPLGRLRPLDQITRMGWKPPKDPKAREAQQRALQRSLDVHPRTDCNACHR
jgi:hypothetical protein